MSTTLYGEIIEIGPDGQPIVPTIVLAFRSGEKQGVIQNIQSFTQSDHLMSAHEISFNVHKGEGDNLCALWDEVKDFKLVYIPHLGMNRFNPWYELTVTIDEGNETIKHCQGVHVQEAELSQLILHEFEVNTETDIAREDYVVTTLYNTGKKEGSLLHRILKDKASHYSIAHVDETLANKQRTFSWNGTSIVDAFNDIETELECIFVYGESAEDDGQIHRTISVYDLNDYCLDCGERGSFAEGHCTKCGSENIRYGYGEDTGIFINYENFAENVNYSSNTNSVKNCFRLVAGDDLMTATVKSLNPNESQYIWYLSNAVRADMSEALRTKLAEYDALTEYYEERSASNIPQASIVAYNELVNKYKAYDSTLDTCAYPVVGHAALIKLYYDAVNLYNLIKTSLAPLSKLGRATSAQEQIETLNAFNLSPLGVSNATTISATTVNSVLLNYARVYIDTSLFKVSIENSIYANNVWTGQLRLTSYSDEEDTAITPTLVIRITDAEPEYLRCQIEKTMKKNEDDASIMVDLFKKDNEAFKSALHIYSIDNLNMLANMARGCLDVLIQHGQATPEAAMYEPMYLKYYEKSEYIQKELRDREAEVIVLRRAGNTAKGVLDYIESARESIVAALDLHGFLGETLWCELCSYRRDDTYQNDNFISDGLSDTELVAMAQEFLSYAKTEIVKSATLQHTISCDLNNFLLVREHDVQEKEVSIATHGGIRLVTDEGRYLVKLEAALSPLNYKFAVGNWIHVEIDGIVFKLRMTDFDIDYDNLQSIVVEFSDIMYSPNATDDIKSVLSKAQSVATTYNVTQRQANKGYDASEQIVNMVSNGLDLTNKRIINSATNQTLLVDDTGMLMRAKNDYDDDFNAEQVKIINHGLYYTNDNWRTVQAGIGKFVCWDVESGKYIEDYGLIARKIVGNIIIGNDLGIYNQNGSMTMNQDGLTITSDASDVKKDLFKLRKKNSDGSYTNYMYVNDNGDIVINGSYMQITSTDMFNKLTNNGEVQGIYMKNGKIYLNCEYIDAHTLAAEKIKGSITNGSWGIDFTNGTMSIGKLAVGSITGTLGNTSAGNWGINFNNGTMSIGKLAVGSITGTLGNTSAGNWGIDFTNGTMSIGKLAVGSITGTLGNTSAGNWGINFNNGTMSIGKLAVGSITGTLGNTSAGNWGIDFTNGTMSIGNLSANKIVAGILTDKTGKNSWNLDTGTFITKQGKIGDFTITSNGLSGVYETSTNKSSISFTGDGLMVKQISWTDPTSGLTVVTNKEVQISNGEISFRSSSVGVGGIYCDDAGNELQVHNGAGSTIIAIPRTAVANFYGIASSAYTDSENNIISTTYLKNTNLRIIERTPTSTANGNIDLAVRSPEVASGNKYVVVSVWCTQKFNPPEKEGETGSWANANYICTPFRYGNWWYARVTTTAGAIVASTQLRIKVAYMPLGAFKTNVNSSGEITT